MTLLKKYIHTIISECVSTLRDTAIITGISENSDGSKTIYAINSLEENDVVIIKNVEYVARLVTPLSFVIDSSLVFSVGLSFTSMAPYFLHEKQKKANEILSVREQGVIDRFKKYPLVLLVRPWVEDYSNPDVVKVTDIRIIIVNYTDQNWNADERYANNITPKLDSIYDKLLTAMVSHDSIVAYSVHQLNHKREDNCLIDGNPLPDNLDGILLTFSLDIERVNICSL